jgi:hypothetical protein
MTGKFANLKNHATKIIKFNQSKVTDNEEVFFAQIDASMRGLNFDIQGLCAALTMAFLGDMLKALQGPSSDLIELFSTDFLTRFNRDAGVSTAGSATNRQITAKIIVPMHTYINAVATEGDAAFDKLAAGQGLRPTVELISPDTVGATFLQDAHAWIMQRTALLLFVETEGQERRPRRRHRPRLGWLVLLRPERRRLLRPGQQAERLQRRVPARPDGSRLDRDRGQSTQVRTPEGVADVIPDVAGRLHSGAANREFPAVPGMTRLDRFTDRKRPSGTR